MSRGLQKLERFPPVASVTSGSSIKTLHGCVRRWRSSLSGSTCNLFDNVHDATPWLGVLDLRECLYERESIRRGEEI